MKHDANLGPDPHYNVCGSETLLIRNYFYVLDFTVINCS